MLLRPGRTLPAVALLALVLSGCADPADPAPVAPPAPDPVDHRVLLHQAPVGDALEAATFGEPVALATGFGGEPTLVAAADGTLWATFPGCFEGGCANGAIYRSTDGGATWAYLNEGDGGLGDGPEANGDAMLALDAAGTLYASNLGGGIPVWRSTDRGDTWTYLADVVPASDSADRQWAWGGPAGMAVQAWMSTSPTRSAAVALSRDGGETWTPPVYADAEIGWIGPIAGSADGQALWVPYTKPLLTPEDDPTGLLMVAAPQVELRMLRSLDGGATWESATTGVLVTKNPARLQWPGTLMAPVMGLTGDGTLVYAWAEEVLGAGRAQAGHAAVRATLSRDNGTTWSDPVTVSGARTAIMPWIVPGSGGRFALAYYAASDVVASSDYEGTWDVDLAMVDGGTVVTSTVAADVHRGGICAKGGMCFVTGSDRSLLDFLGGTLLPDGRVAVAYASSPLSPAGLLSDTTVHVAVQDGGSRLLALDAPAPG